MSSSLNELKKSYRVRFQHAAKDHLKSGDASAKIAQLLKEILPVKSIVGSYKAMKNEVSLSGLELHYQMVFPRVENSGLVFYKPNTETSFVANPFGIDEPIPEQSIKVEVQKINVLLIPGVAFDRNCQRLGRGKGYYDRFLENYNGLKIGVTTTSQISNEDLPVEAHDQAMDMVVTDQFILRRFDA